MSIQEGFKQSLQALSLPFEDQVELFPSFVEVGDELLLNFENCKQAIVKNLRRQITDQQFEQIVRLDTLIERIEANKLWGLSNLKDHKAWEDLRIVAKSTLTAFGWTLEPPPSSKKEYVEG